MDSPLLPVPAPSSGRSQRLYWPIGILALLVCAGIVWFLYPAIGNRFFESKRSVSTDAELIPAIAAFNANDFKSALNDIDAILANKPKDVQALLLKATILAQQGSLTFKENDGGAQSIAIANQILAIDPSNDEAYRVIGYASEIMQQYPAAHAAYARALTLNPKNAAALAGDAHAYDLQGNYAAAEKGYRAALAIAPSLDLPQMGLVRILLRQGRNTEAQATLSNVIADTQNVRIKAEATYMSGLVVNLKGDHASSEQLMRQAIQYDSTYALAYEGLARELFLEARDASPQRSSGQRLTLVNQSFTALITAAKLNPNQASVYYQLGLELLFVGQKGPAAQALTKAEQTVPLDISLSSSDKSVFITQIQYALKQAS